MRTLLVFLSLLAVAVVLIDASPPEASPLPDSIYAEVAINPDDAARPEVAGSHVLSDRLVLDAAPVDVNCPCATCAEVGAVRCPYAFDETTADAAPFVERRDLTR